MEVKGSLGKVRTWVWLGVGGLFATVVKYTIENSKPPEWVSGSTQWAFGVSADAFNAFAAVTIPLWSVLILGLMLILIFSFVSTVLGKRLSRALKRNEEVTLANSELTQSCDSLRDESQSASLKCTDLSESLSKAYSAVDQLKSERDTVRQELERIKVSVKNVPLTMENLIASNAFGPPAAPNSSLKAARFKSPRHVADEAKEEVLKAVMLCTKSKTSTNVSEIVELVSVEKWQLEKLLKSLVSDGYISMVVYGYYPCYQLSKKAKLHFKSIENNVPSELKFT